ncbi:MAG: hypothetical protein ACUVTZ_03150 [Armatimonadota bacterium]
MGGQGDMSMREAGRKGGEATARRHGREFFSQIGKKGGMARKEQLGREGYQRLGRMGGLRVRELVEKGKQRSAADSPGDTKPG